jgi:hypothetical protein
MIHEDEFLGPYWSTIIYNGFGIYISHPKMADVTIDDVEGSYDDSSDSYYFKGLEIKHALQYFYDLRVMNIRVSNIAVICGDLADRGISFVSENYQWHLNQMYYVPPKNVSVSHAIQAAGRLCGKYNDNVPLALFAPENVIDNVVKGIEIQEETIERALKMSGRKLIDAVQTMHFNEDKIPSSKLGRVKSGKFKKATLENPDTGRKLEEYLELLEKKKVCEFSVKKKQEANEEIRRGAELGMPEKEYLRLTTKMFPRWSKADSKIARFMHALDPEKLYTEKEMKELCKIQGMSNLNHLCNKFTGKNSHNGFGNIIQKENNTYRLYSSLIQSFKQYF